MTNLAIVGGVSRGVLVAWVDMTLHGRYHACCIAVHRDPGELDRRVARWRRLDRSLCDGVMTAEAADALTVEVTVDPQHPAERGAVPDAWGHELAFRRSMHRVSGRKATLDDVVIDWAESIGMGPVCAHRMFNIHDLQCGVGE